LFSSPTGPIFLVHQVIQILSKEDNHLEEILANLSDVSLVYDQPENLLSGVKHLGTIRLQKEPCTIRFKPFKHMEAQEISVQSKPPKSFKFGYSIDRSFDVLSCDIKAVTVIFEKHLVGVATEYM
jgi:hypothetical protein